MEKKIRIHSNTTQFINQAWTRNGSSYVTGEGLILVCLLHTHSADRTGSDFKAVQALMDDVNLDDKE